MEAASIDFRGPIRCSNRLSAPPVVDIKVPPAISNIIITLPSTTYFTSIKRSRCSSELDERNAESQRSRKTPCTCRPPRIPRLLPALPACADDVNRTRRTVACLEPNNAERMARLRRRKAVKTDGRGCVERDDVKWILGSEGGGGEVCARDEEQRRLALWRL
jgi:hypothetical protein